MSKVPNVFHSVGFIGVGVIFLEPQTAFMVPTGDKTLYTGALVPANYKQHYTETAYMPICNLIQLFSLIMHLSNVFQEDTRQRKEIQSFGNSSPGPGSTRIDL